MKLMINIFTYVHLYVRKWHQLLVQCEHAVMVHCNLQMIPFTKMKKTTFKLYDALNACMRGWEYWLTIDELSVLFTECWLFYPYINLSRTFIKKTFHISNWTLLDVQIAWVRIPAEEEQTFASTNMQFKHTVLTLRVIMNIICVCTHVSPLMLIQCLDLLYICQWLRRS